MGVLFSLVQFLNNRSLWLDEASLALNIIAKSPGELLKPLDLNQVAPILYLQITKMLSLITPNAEYGLRLFSLIGFWASMALFYKSLRILFKQNFLVVIALTLFVFNHSLIYYSSEVKQYMADVLVAVSFLYLVLRSDMLTNAECILFAISGTVAIYLSNIAPFILFSSGVYLMFRHWPCIDKKYLYKLMLIGTVWMIAFIVYYLLFVHEHPTRTFMKEYWHNEGSFLPKNLFSAEFIAFFIEKIKSQGYFALSGFWLLSAGLLTFAGAGVVYMVRNHRLGLILLLLLPAFLHLALSACQMYPFARRLTLYLIPYLIIFGVFGIQAVLQWTGFIRKINVLLVLGALFPLIASALLMMDLPKERQEIK